ncbi:MAG: pirin family protein, partial [Oceanobacter sp.]
MPIHLKGKATNLDGIQVTRLLPNAKKRMVGPFIFLDHMGPVTFAAGEGIDVKPHPHIGLATLTYLTEGSILHRDSLGNELEILPGEVNWMIAGRGIVHSERETLAVRNQAHQLNGVQCWLALPKSQAEIEPEFFHYKNAELPAIKMPGVHGQLIAGTAYGKTSPVKTHSPLCYLDLTLAANGQLAPPSEAEECAIYLLEGSIQ